MNIKNHKKKGEKEARVNNAFRIKVNTKTGGYGFTDTLLELLADVEKEYDSNEVKKVFKWAKASKDGDEYVSEDGRMHIFNIEQTPSKLKFTGKYVFH